MKKVFLMLFLVTLTCFGAEKKYYHFEGLLGNTAIAMDINLIDGSYRASYSYNKYGENIELGGDVQKDKNKINLSAYNSDEVFEGTIVNNKFEGLWKSGNKSLKFSLSEDKNSLTLDEIKNLNMSPLYLSTKNDNYTNITTIVYNRNGLIVAEDYNYYYFEGAAHGNYGVSYRNYHKELGYLIDFNDFFTEEAYDILPSIIKRKIDQQDIYTFDDVSYITENVYFTEKGVMFVFNPYEISSYAQGIVSIYVPYAEIPKKAILNNEITKKIIKW
ncbi:MAG: DUF3298 domain-containing protein [Fusobacteriaceae bacterium]|nr:DUF3298 domain-containing protein [Fusobacteriaceae bacterium]